MIEESREAEVIFSAPLNTHYLKYERTGEGLRWQIIKRIKAKTRLRVKALRLEHRVNNRAVLRASKAVKARVKVVARDDLKRVEKVARAAALKADSRAVLKVGSRAVLKVGSAAALKVGSRAVARARIVNQISFLYAQAR